MEDCQEHPGLKRKALPNPTQTLGVIIYHCVSFIVYVLLLIYKCCLLSSLTLSVQEI